MITDRLAPQPRGTRIKTGHRMTKIGVELKEPTMDFALAYAAAQAGAKSGTTESEKLT